MFLLDTGADFSVAPRRLAQQVGLEWTTLPEAQVVGVEQGSGRARMGPLPIRLESLLQRLKGEVFLAQAAENHAVAEACLQQALAVARRQHAKSWELGAAISLARLWQCRASALRLPNSWHRFTAGSLRVLTRPTSKMPGGCWTRWRAKMGMYSNRLHFLRGATR